MSKWVPVSKVDIPPVENTGFKENIIIRTPVAPEIIEEAIVFMNTHKQANRIKCATLGWTGIKKILDQE